MEPKQTIMVLKWTELRNRNYSSRLLKIVGVAKYESGGKFTSGDFRGVQGFLVTSPSVLIILEECEEDALAVRIEGDWCFSLEAEGIS